MEAPGGGLDHLLTPLLEFVEALGWMFGDAGENIGKPNQRIGVVHLCGDHQRVLARGSVTAAIGAREQLGLPAERDTTMGALGGIAG